MNLRSRLAISLMCVVLLTIIGVGLGAVSAARSVPRDNVDDFLRRTATQIRSRPIESVRDLNEVGRNLIQARRDDQSFGETTRFQVLFKTGDVVTTRASGGLPINEAEWQVAIDGGPDILRSVRWNDINYRMITFSIPEIGAFQLARDVDDADQLVKGLLPRMALWGIAGALLAGVGGWFIADRIAEPIARLTETSERVARTQDLAERIPVDRSDEVGRLATSLNTMLAALETSRRQQNQLVLDANHELRTPLTSLRTNIEVLQRNDRTLEGADRDQLLVDVKAELDELTDLVSELVESATSIDQSTEQLQTVELSEIVEGAVELARRRTGRVIGLTASRPAVVSVRPNLIARAVQNLLSNAHKFSPPDTPVTIDVSGTTVTVSDAGPGIRAEDQAYVFDRFYRATDSRSKPGSGLGLAIVKQIAESHGGTVHVGTSSTGGASVGFDLAAAVHTRPGL